MTSLIPLPPRFFRRQAEVVARELLGQLLVRVHGERRLIVRIVETEAYLGEGDRASHAWRGQRTPRTATLFRPGGVAYVYLVYGIHHLFNVVTGKASDGSAVLVRAGEPVEGIRFMQRNRGLETGARDGAIAGGPGKLSQALAIDLGLNGAVLGSSEISVCRGARMPAASIAVGQRIGVAYSGPASLWPLRFAERLNPHVSRPYPWPAG
ncbi:MAG: DNA-3-methyladenine glycosylase [Acidobacteriota bacterium]|nr:DNA-3-methyladenine glycosylase [Acidobacteriota bacterium]